MTILLQSADFETAGTLGGEWATTGGTFYSDGQRASPSSSATYSRALIVATPPLSASTPIKARYEVDFTLPTTFPATGIVRGGLVFGGGFGHLVWTRTSGGASTVFDFFARNGSTGVETSFYSSSVSLSAGTTVRLRADVTYWGGGLIVEARYSTDGGATFVFLWISTPSTGAWNTATGQTLADGIASSRKGGIVANIAFVFITPQPFGPPNVLTVPTGYIDRFRLYDIGNLATNPIIDVAPSLTAFPTLTPYTMSEDDDGGAETLTVQPSYAMQVTDDWSVAEHPYDGGYVGTVARQTVRRRSWRFHWDAMNVSDVVAFGALRTAVAGRRSTFSWTDPTTGEALRIRFDDGPSVSLVAPSIWQADALVSEVPANA